MLTHSPRVHRITVDPPLFLFYHRRQRPLGKSGPSSRLGLLLAESLRRRRLPFPLPLVLAGLRTERMLFLPGSKGSTTTSSVPLISARQNGQPWPSDSCQEERQGVQRRWPHGSIRTSLSFSAQILHSWNVEPISQ